MREAGVKAGLPAEAIGCMSATTIEGTEALMKHKLTAVILATGGLGPGARRLLVGQARLRRRPRQRPGLHRADGRRGQGGARHPRRARASTTARSAPPSRRSSSTRRSTRRSARSSRAGRATSERGAGRAAGEARRHAAARAQPGDRRQAGDGIAEMAGISVPPETRCLIAEVGGRRTRLSALDREALADPRLSTWSTGWTTARERCDRDPPLRRHGPHGRRSMRATREAVLQLRRCRCRRRASSSTRRRRTARSVTRRRSRRR